jgi:S1-C subfamily serine protease
MFAAPGDPRRLSLGSFIYVLGYPGGYPMVTRAIVSDPNRDRRGGFVTDGLWNEGISGGPILAVRGDDGALEWVGITRAGAGVRETLLLPEDMDPPDEDFFILYDGAIYAESALRIQYGIALTVPMLALRSFVSAHRSALSRRGYDVRRF